MSEQGNRLMVRSVALLGWTRGSDADCSLMVTVPAENDAKVIYVSRGMAEKRLRGHQRTVNSASFSPDGKHVVTASEDGTARLWDAASCRELAVLVGEAGEVQSAAFSDDGRRVVTVAACLAEVWSVPDGAAVSLLRGHEDSIVSAMFDSGGERVVTASRDETARVWNASNGTQMTDLRGHRDGLVFASFNPAGDRVATASEDGTARVWDPSSGAEMMVLRGHERGVTSAVFSPDGTLLATSSKDRTARLWDVTTGRALVVLRGHAAAVEHVAFSPDGKLVMTVSEDASVRVWNASGGEQVAVLGGGTGRSLAIAEFTPDGTRLVACGAVDEASGEVVVADVESLQGLVDDDSTPVCPVCRSIRCGHLAAIYWQDDDMLQLCGETPEIGREFSQLESEMGDLSGPVDWQEFVEDDELVREWDGKEFCFDEHPVDFHKRAITWLRGTIEQLEEERQLAREAPPECPFCVSSTACSHQLWIACGSDPISWRREGVAALAAAEQALLEALRGWVKRGSPRLGKRSAPLAELLDDETIGEERPRRLTAYWNDSAIAVGVVSTVEWESDGGYPGGGDSGVNVYASDVKKAVEELLNMVRTDIAAIEGA